MPVSARDRSYERGVLDAAEVLAGIPSTGYGRRVLDRLDSVGAKYGDRFTGMELRELLDEIEQEAADVAGWGVLTAQRAMLETLPEPMSHRFRMKLLELAAVGARADQLVAEARAIVGAT